MRSNSGRKGPGLKLTIGKDNYTLLQPSLNRNLLSPRKHEMEIDMMKVYHTFTNIA